jgi:hypothetical protein
MILYQVVSSIIDYQVVQRLEERRKKREESSLDISKE